MSEGRDQDVMNPDAELVNRTLNGDLEGFGELHSRYFERLTLTVTRIVRDRAKAEDVAQEAYHMALESLPRLGDPSRFFPWLRRIAVNRAVDETRRWGRKDRLHTAWAQHQEPGESLPTALDHLVDDERAKAVREAVELLPEKQRAAVVLRFYQGLSVRDAAEVMDCREVSVRSNVFRGLQKLGALLGARDEETT